MSYEMVVGDDSFDCSKVTVPLTVESPRRTATVAIDNQSACYTKHWVAKGDMSISKVRRNGPDGIWLNSFKETFPLAAGIRGDRSGPMHAIKVLKFRSTPCPFHHLPRGLGLGFQTSDVPALTILIDWTLC